MRGNGDVYVAIRHYRARPNRNYAGNVGGIVALRDTDGDGKADERESFDGVGGTGLRFHDGYLYLGRTSEIVRYRMTPGALVPSGEAETSAEDDDANASAEPCPCCGGAMIIIEVFEPGCQPKHRPKYRPPPEAIDSS